MALIRQAEAQRIAGDAVVLDLGSIERDAAALRAKAKSDVERIVQDAQTERARIVQGAREAGHKLGFDEGKAAGLAAGREEGIRQALQETRESVAKIESALAAALAGFEAERSDLHADARQRLLTLSLALAEKIIRRAIACDPSVVSEQVAAVLQQVTKPTRITLRVSPSDRPIIHAALPALLGQLARSEHVDLLEDSSLSRGSVILRTVGGAEVNATIEQQLERLTSALLGEQPTPAAPSIAPPHPQPPSGQGPTP